MAVRTSVYPAYERMRAALIAERPKAEGVEDGVGRLPDGAAYYQAMLRQFTTSDYTPEQVHQLGLAEVARISAEMDTLLRSQGLETGTVVERMAALRTDPRFLFENTEAGREQLLARYRESLDDIALRMPEYFKTIPPGKLAVERIPASAEMGSAMAYYSPAALDGSRQGTFYANLRDTSELPTWGMKTLAVHEGIPGHHFQIAMARELKGLPLLRQQPIYTAYTEGWALYAERLAAEIGFYQNDPFGDLGRLQAEIRDASLQFVRRLSGFHRPSKVNAAAFDRATEEIAAAARLLLASLVTEAEPRSREVEALKAKARSAQRFAVRE